MCYNRWFAPLGMGLALSGLALRGIAQDADPVPALPSALTATPLVKLAPAQKPPSRAITRTLPDGRSLTAALPVTTRTVTARPFKAAQARQVPQPVQENAALGHEGV